MRDPNAPPATRVTAADKILDRALGKAPQAVEVKGEKRGLLEYSIADLVAIAYQRGMEGGSIEGEAKDVGDVVGSDAPPANPPSEFEYIRRALIDRGSCTISSYSSGGR